MLVFEQRQGERSAPPPLETPPADGRSGAARLWRGSHRSARTRNIPTKSPPGNWMRMVAYAFANPCSAPPGPRSPAIKPSKEARMHAEQLKFSALMKHKYGSETTFGNKEE